MTDLDWLVEHDELPPEQDSSPEPPSPPRRRFARWLGLFAALFLFLLGLFAYLWQLGGQVEPPPTPIPPENHLRAAVQLEMNALRNNDPEIFSQLQDQVAESEYLQAPLETWLAGMANGTGAIELMDLQLIDQDSAQVEIKLDWEDQLYRLNWFYRQEGDQWLHTDWQEFDLGPVRTIASQHIQLIHHQTEEEQAEALLDRLDRLLFKLCGALSCPAESFEITLWFDPTFSSFYVKEISPLYYRLPSPWRIRWPWDGQPEPFLLGSIARHLVFDLYTQDAIRGLDIRNRAALTLSTFWLAHHLAGLESPPTTYWLDEAVARDGLPTVAVFVAALAEGIPPNTAMNLTFREETVIAITALPDYFGWLVQVSPTSSLRPYVWDSDFPAPWQRDLAERFDLEAELWAPAGQIYDRACPVMDQVRYHDQWAIVTTQENSIWGSHYLFHQEQGTWVPARPGEILAPALRTVTWESFTITFCDWDSDSIPIIIQTINKPYHALSSNFQLPERPHSIILTPPPHIATIPDIEADLILYSPPYRGPTTPGQRPDYQTLTTWNLVGFVLLEQFDRLPAEGIKLLLGMMHWQMNQLDLDSPVLLADPELSERIDEWSPPHDIASPEWTPLPELWTGYKEPPNLVDILYPALLVEYLVDRHGLEKLGLMLQTLEEAGSMNEWVTGVTGMPLADFEPQWRQWVLGRWGISDFQRPNF